MKRRKMTRANKNKFAMSMYILIGFCFVVGGVFNFMVGFHNSDLGWNMKVLNSQHDLGLVDVGLGGQVAYDNEMIRTGAWAMIFGFLITFVGAFMFGMGMGILGTPMIKYDEGASR